MVSSLIIQVFSSFTLEKYPGHTLRIPLQTNQNISNFDKKCSIPEFEILLYLFRITFWTFRMKSISGLIFFQNKYLLAVALIKWNEEAENRMSLQCRTCHNWECAIIVCGKKSSWPTYSYSIVLFVTSSFPVINYSNMKYRVWIYELRSKLLGENKQ